MEKNTENRQIYSFLFFSTVIHAILLSFLLMIPVYGNISDQIFITHLVSLDEAKKDGPVIPAIRVSNKHRDHVAKAQKIITADRKTLPEMQMSKHQLPKDDFVQPSQGSVPPVSNKTADNSEISKEEHQVSEKESSDKKSTVEKDTVSSPIPEGQAENAVPVQYQDINNDVISEGGTKAETIHAEEYPVKNETPLPEKTKTAEKPQINSAENIPGASFGEPEAESTKLDATGMQSAENEIAGDLDAGESVPESPYEEQSGAAAPADIIAGTAPEGQPAGKNAPAGAVQLNTASQGAGIALNGAAEPVREEVATKIGMMESVPGLPLAAALVPKDIMIEIQPSGGSSPDISVSLSRKPYPKSTWKVIEGKPQAVELITRNEDIEMNSKKTPGITFSVSDAEKGIYSFSVRNTGQDAREYAIRFILFQGKEKERTKEYASLSIPPGTSANFRFVLPDLVFWDDDASFSGVIEDSKSVTKFIYNTGLVWRERKD